MWSFVDIALWAATVCLDYPGTFIECQIPASNKLRYLNARKGGTTGTNLLLACNFDMYITFASAGAEATAHDGFVLRRATATARLRLPPGERKTRCCCRRGQHHTGLFRCRL